MNNKTKQKQIREEIEYLFKHGNSNPPHSYEHIQGNDSKYANQYTKDVIMAIFAREQDLHEIEIRKGILRRISLNESNDYPLVDESKSLADVKEAQINRIKQLTTQLPEEKAA